MAVGRGQEIAMGWSAVGGPGVVVAWGGKSRSWGGSVEERENAMGFVSGGWECEGVCNELGFCTSGRGRLDAEG